jgi:tagatose-1,6-bisphosphate aldolase non-catalytic subunit AgaZ/GatZ
MQRVKITEVVKAAMGINNSNEKVTLLGIGPMSKTLIKAVFLLAKNKDFPIMFIASRNQVDATELGGGYVCNWNQKEFCDTIDKIAKEVEFDGLYYKCRDHGGPWQRDNERNAKLPEDKAMELAKKSYLEDLINGFDLLHIDPTKDPYVKGKIVPMEDVLRRTIELIDYIERERMSRNLPPIGYEVGTEETNGGLTSEETYEKFIKILTSELSKRKLPTPLFIVGQTGTLTRLTENIGNFSSANAKKLADIAMKYNVGLKEHNGDYLDDYILLEHPKLGVTGMNVAPEFGTVETKAYLQLTKVEEQLYILGIIKEKSRLAEVLIEESVKSERWRKWMIDDVVYLDVDEVFKNKELSYKIAEISGHYTYNIDIVKEERLRLYSNLKKAGINGEKYVIEKLMDSIGRYVKCLNLEGFTSKVLKRL